MQLLQLYIKDFKILKDFTIDFSKEFSITDSSNVIIGENGAGKSTLIESILRIFSALYSCKDVKEVSKILNGKDDFEFTLSYFAKAEKIIEAASTFSSHKVDYVKVTVSNISKQWLVLDYEDKQLVNEEINNFLFKSQYKLQDLLPKNTVLYYAGFDSRLSEFVNNYTAVYFKEWFTFLENDSKGLSINAPIFYFNPVQFNLLLFALFCNESTEVSKFLQHKFGIIGFTEVKLNLKIPKWHKGNSVDTFWGSQGILKEALLRFESSSQEKVVTKKTIKYSYFLPSVLLNLVGQSEDISFTSEKEVFQSLVAFDIMGLLDSVEITLVKKSNDTNIEISSQDLSEGEKQIISIYGLKQIMSSHEESLFLFDEPDTFLHPKWKREFFKDIYYDENGAKIHYGDFDIITTHSPEIIGNIDDNKSLKLISNGKILPTPIYVKGRDYNSILFSAFNSIKRDDYGKRLLEDFYNLIDSKLIDKAKIKLAEIIDKFGNDDIETQKAIENLDDFN